MLLRRQRVSREAGTPILALAYMCQIIPWEKEHASKKKEEGLLLHVWGREVGNVKGRIRNKYSEMTAG